MHWAFRAFSSSSSPSSRRAWIEIGLVSAAAEWDKVALLAEGVDRNMMAMYRRTALSVALLAEGVDRNMVLASCFVVV